jgi:transcriptional regulator of heat shock response
MEVITSREDASDGIQVYIGTENEGDIMQGATLIFKNVCIGGDQVAIGVIGPKRMNYHRVIDMISRLASGIEMLSEEKLDTGHALLLGTDEE